MIRTGFTFNNPLTESRWMVVESDAETGGMGWRLEVRCLPGASADILEHRRLTWTETFKIISGVAHCKVDGVFATLFGLAGEGKVGRQGLPKNPLQFAATARALARYDSYDARFPIPMQKLLAATLGRLAETLDYKSVYPEYV